MHSLDIFSNKSVLGSEDLKPGLDRANSELDKRDVDGDNFKRHFDREVSNKRDESKPERHGSKNTDSKRASDAPGPRSNSDTKSHSEPTNNKASFAQPQSEKMPAPIEHDVGDPTTDQASAEAFESHEITIVALETAIPNLIVSGAHETELKTKGLATTFNLRSDLDVDIRNQSLVYPSQIIEGEVSLDLAREPSLNIAASPLSVPEALKDGTPLSHAIPGASDLRNVKYNLAQPNELGLNQQVPNIKVEPLAHQQAMVENPKIAAPYISSETVLDTRASTLNTDLLSKLSVKQYQASDSVDLFSEKLLDVTNSTAVGLATVKQSGLDQSFSLASQASRFSVNIQFGRVDWNTGVAAKVAQMAAQNLNYAEIQLDPPELGPLQVRVQVNNDQATVSFSSHSVQVRDALEQGNQRLRELLESEGLNLVDVDVSDQQQQGQDDELESEASPENTNFASENIEDETMSADDTTHSVTLNVGVDDFV